MPESTITGIGPYPKDVPANRNIRIERTGKWPKLLSFLDFGLWGLCFSRNGGIKMNPWEYCNSLRYGFDDEYDSPVFDDEDTNPERDN